MWRSFQRWLDKWPLSAGLIQPGHWRVRYNDGQWSMRMTYDICRDYAQMFGGVVHWVRYDDPVATQQANTEQS